MNLVLDTSVLLYWTLGPERLSPAASDALAGLGGERKAALCSVSVWEIALKHQAGRLGLGMTVDDFVHRIHRLPLEIVPVDAWLWIESVRLDWSHRDPADRLVVALARRLGAGVITSDRRMAGYHDRVVW